MIARVHIIHGIHVSEPDNSVGKLRPYFETYGYPVLVHDYGHIFAWQARFRNEGIAERIAKHVQPGDIVIGHSNGCAIIHLMAKKGVQFKGAVLINAALDRDAQIENGAEWVHVYHNKGDGWTSLSRLLFWHPWGAMGQKGYEGPDRRVRNFDCYPDVDGHSDIFTKLPKWGRIVASNVLVADKKNPRPDSVPERGSLLGGLPQ